MDRLMLHEARSVCAWPSTDRDQLLAVAHRDLHVARQNITNLTRYLDIQSEHLAACAASDVSVTLFESDLSKNSGQLVLSFYQNRAP